jgi:tRNA(fMet)-specific endonuclease VapC
LIPPRPALFPFFFADAFKRLGVGLRHDTDAAYYGAIRAHLARPKPNALPIGPYDLTLAAHALRVGAAVVTHNAAEFRRVPGLVVEDWQS